MGTLPDQMLWSGAAKIKRENGAVALFARDAPAASRPSLRE